MIKKTICHDCGVEEGHLHKYGCDMERCPFCGNQLITCLCRYELLGIDVSEGSWAYHHGLTDEQEVIFQDKLNRKGRIPYIEIPFLCPICGKVYPTMFDVPDEEWDKYIIPSLQPEAFCTDCYNRMKELFPNGWRNAT